MIHIDLKDFQYIINYEYVAILIMIIMLGYMIFEKLLKFRRSRIFNSSIILSIISTSIDIIKSYLVNTIIKDPSVGESMITVINVLQTLYLLLLFVSIFGFLTYIAFITCGLEYIHRKTIRKIMFYVPEMLLLIITFLNFFSPTVLRFSFDNGIFFNVNIPGIFVSVSLSMIYLIYSIILMFKYRKIFEKKQVATITFVVPLMAVGFVTQLIVPKLLILSFMIAICIILVLTVLESSEDMIDDNTKMYNEEELIKVVKKCYFSHEGKSIVLIKMGNFKDLMKSYNMVDIFNYTRETTIVMNKFKKANSLKFEMYSLNNGYYAFVGNNDYNVNFRTEDLLDYVYSIGICPDFIPDYEICYIRLTEDFENSDEAINFINNYRDIISFDSNFTKYSLVKDEKDLNIKNHLEQIIDTALKENEFQVYYQPIYSIKEKKFKTAEALVRLISKKYGFISPGSFIPYAENTGRITEIDSFVMEEVFKFVSSPTFEELGLDYIEINLSIAECVQNNLISRIKTLLDKYNVNPSRINIEITESYDTDEQRKINKNLNKLVELGFRLSLDDFGTGYSNISRFSTMPISIIKIDKSLVDKSIDEDIKKVLDYSFKLVNELDKETVIEGVETLDQLERFKEYGATFIQGFYFSKPLDYNNYVDFVKNNN